MLTQPSWESVTEFLLRLPETEFVPHSGHFPRGVVRVRGKVISYPAGGDRGSPPDPREGEEFVFIKTDPNERAALLSEQSKSFYLTPHYEGSGGVIVRLSTVDRDQLGELLVDAWRLMAPKRLVAAYDHGSPTGGWSP